jgi:hypothetical protein
VRPGSDGAGGRNSPSPHNAQPSRQLVGALYRRLGDPSFTAEGPKCELFANALAPSARATNQPRAAAGNHAYGALAVSAPWAGASPSLAGRDHAGIAQTIVGATAQGQLVD